MLLAELADAAEGVAITPVPNPLPAITVTDVVHDTRSVRPGALFCCVRGSTADGHDLAPDAIAGGAAALLGDHHLDLDAPQLLVDDVRGALGPVAAAFHGNPSRAMTVVGVTGTNGKTTTVHLLASIFEADGQPTGVIGTLSGARTTPEAPELQARLAAERARGRQAVAMEVSSHAFAMGRVRATRFAVAVFTNLSVDHLDFHGSLEAYFAAKATLFDPAYAGAAVVNLDDEHGRRLRDMEAIPTEGYQLADAVDLAVGASRSRFVWRGQPVELALGGRFNVANALAAATTADVLGIDRPVIAEGLAAISPVPGRFEPIDAGQPFTVTVDFAHTPDALASALVAARDVAGVGQVVVVFGCGGDRDASKRPLMGEVASRLADRVLLTNDNPRSEDPMAIIDAIRTGVRGSKDVVVEPDRRAAIALAIAAAEPGDVILIAGKGHETTQTIGDDVRPFDDHEVARAALEEAGW